MASLRTYNNREFEVVTVRQSFDNHIRFRAVMAAILLLLCIFLRDLKAVSRLSMACSMAQLVVMLITMVYCMSRIKSWSWSKVKIVVTFKFRYGAKQQRYCFGCKLPLLLE